MRNPLLFSGVLVLALLSRGAVHCEAQVSEDQRSAEAKKLFDAGVKFAEKGDWEKAVAAFRDAETMEKRPSIALHMGKALIQVGNVEEAILRLDALANDPATDHLRALEARRLADEARARSAQLALTVDPAAATDAAVELDGKPRSESGRPRLYYLNAGEHQLKLTATGYHTFTDKFLLAAGNRFEKSLTLIPLPAVVTPVAAAPAMALAAPAPMEPMPAPAEDDGSVFESPWFWAISGAVVAATVVVVVVLAGGGDKGVDCGSAGCLEMQ